MNLAISGNILVWGFNNLEIMDGDIYAYDLAAGVEFPVCTNERDQRSPDISGNIIVWADYEPGSLFPYVPPGPSDIHGYDLSTGTEFTICTAPGYQARPRISGNTVVWIDNRDEVGYDVYGYDLASGTEFRITTSGAAAYDLRIDGNIVVWTDYRNGDRASLLNGDIYAYDLSTGLEFPVATGPAEQTKPAVSGNTIVYYERPDKTVEPAVMGYDTASESAFLVSSGPANPDSYPDISGDVVVWMQHLGGSDYSIFGHDLAKQEDFFIMSAFYTYRMLAIDGDTVANGHPGLRVATIPEPGACLLLGSIAGALLARSRRRR